MKTEVLLQLISHNDIFIFGTGFAAEMFWRGLKKHGLAEHVKGFMRSNPLPGEMFHGLPVSKSISGNHCVVCVAVHEAVAAEIIDAAGSVLNMSGDSIIWVYPNIHELLFGSPVAIGQRMALSELLRKQNPGDHWLDVRYLAAEGFLKEDAGLEMNAPCRKEVYWSAETKTKVESSWRAETDDSVKNIYVKAMAIHSSRKTARKRLCRLKDLVKSMAEKGFLPEKPVLIDTDGRIIDGLHRTAVAAALGIREIPCNIVPASDIYHEILTDRFRLTDAVLKEAGFTEEDFSLIREAGRQMSDGV